MSSFVNYTDKNSKIKQCILAREAPSFSDFSAAAPSFGPQPPQLATPTKTRAALSSLSANLSPTPSRALSYGTFKSTPKSTEVAKTAGGLWGDAVLVPERDNKSWEKEFEDGRVAELARIKGRIDAQKARTKELAAARSKAKAAEKKRKREEEEEVEEDEEEEEEKKKGKKKAKAKPKKKSA